MRIGLTGSMAAGKSTVSGILRELGFIIIDADKTAHISLALPEVIEELTGVFGADILDDGGNIDRRTLAKAAFASDEATKMLNSIVHPRVFEHMLHEADEAEAKGHKHIVFDVPLLFETGFERYCDRVMAVIADDELRYCRIMLRDGLTRAEAAARLARQMEQEEKAGRSDAVIINNGTVDELNAAVLEALSTIGIAEKPDDAKGNNAVQNELDCYCEEGLE